MVIQSNPPSYKFADLVNACSTAGKVFVKTTARNDAKHHFGFQTQTAILQFIQNNVFEGLTHENTSTIDKGPDAGLIFDAYIFKIGPNYVYFAFYKKTKVWIIKSFHPPEHGDKTPSLSYNPFGQLKEEFQK